MERVGCRKNRGSSMQSCELALQLGASDFMEKPANIQLLAKKIREAHARKIVLVQKENEAKIRALLDAKNW